MEDSDKLVIELNKLGDKDSLEEFIKTNIPKDIICQGIKAFYAYKLGEYVNSGEYEDISKLEGLLDFHNLIQGIEE